MRALVVGGAGFIGSHVVELLLEGSMEVVVVDDFSSGHATNLPEHEALLYASVGDSHVFRVAGDGAVDLAARESERPYFLGHGEETPESPPQLARPDSCGRRG